MSVDQFLVVSFGAVTCQMAASSGESIVDEWVTCELATIWQVQGEEGRRSQHARMMLGAYSDPIALLD